MKHHIQTLIFAFSIAFIFSAFKPIISNAETNVLDSEKHDQDRELFIIDNEESIQSNETTKEKTVTGWVYENNWYYLDDNGNKKTGWLYDDGNWYYLSENGAMKTGWIQDNGKWYYLSGNGVMKTGWLYDNGNWYYLSGSGAMKTGWLQDKGNWYFFNSSGVMQTGWIHLNGKWYYLSGNGVMKTGWLYDNGKWYYLSSSGAMKTGWIQDKDNWYFLNSSGVMQTGWIHTKGKWYFLAGNGVMKTGWLYDGGRWYYLLSSGEMVTGNHVIDGKPYVFQSTGILTNNKIIGWFKTNNGWYYVKNNGTITTGWSYIKNGWYFFDNQGVMHTGWLLDNNNWYYLNTDGRMVTGHVKINGFYHNFFSNGVWDNAPAIKYSQYNYTLDEMIQKQLAASSPPQTDKYRNDPSYVNGNYIENITIKNGVKIGYLKGTTSLNVYEGPGANYRIVGKITSINGIPAEVRIFDIINNNSELWYRIQYGPWKNAKYNDVAEYVDPEKFNNKESKEYFQYLVLSKPAGVSANEINSRILNNEAGILKGKAQAFINASQKYNVNEIYLISHALLETGNGKSDLASGVKINGKTYYNVYGINAYDHCPTECGAQKAYEEGWDSIDKAIIGGAKYIAEKYIDKGQDTLYKMRWNPAKPATHQYATDVGWAIKQTTRIYNMYQMLDSYMLYFDIPVYKK